MYLACNPAKNYEHKDHISELSLNKNYVRTKLPIHIESINDEVRSFIVNSHETDTSSYLIDTRPIVFQIQGVENNQDEVRYTQPINRKIEVLIYCLGESKENKLVDYGWLENELGEIIWKMKFEESTFAGGNIRNRKVVTPILLSPGTYRLRYVSNDAHANNDWKSDPPEYPFYYGITVFNLKAIDAIHDKMNISE